MVNIFLQVYLVEKSNMYSYADRKTKSNILCCCIDNKCYFTSLVKIRMLKGNQQSSGVMV